MEPASSAVGPRAPATLPLRWRVGFAGHKNLNIDDFNDCSTVISVMSAAPASMNVEVEFFGQNDAFVNDGTTTLAAGAVEVFGTVGGSGGSSGPVGGPVALDVLVNTGNFDSGFAKVHSDEPRLLVTAFLTCRRDRADGGSGTDPLRGFLSIPTFPVGAPAEYFQAGMPAEMESIPVVDPIP
jgi:hypothetical protein